MNENFIEKICAFSLKNWDHFQLAGEKPLRLLPRMVRRTNPASKITYNGIMFYVDPEQDPVLYAKAIPSVQKERYIREHANLDLLDKELKNEKLRQSVMARSLLFDGGRLTLLISRYVPGLSLDVVLSREEEMGGYLAYGDKSLAWLSLLQRDNLHKIGFSQDMVLGEFDLLKDNLGSASAEVQALFDGYLNKIKGAFGAEVPVVYAHGDFAPANIIIRDSEIVCVIDWEEFLQDRLPLMDFLRFIIIFSLNGAALVKAHPSHLDEYLAWVAQAQEKFLREMGIGRDFFEEYARIALVESVNILIKRNKVRKMNGQAMMSLRLHDFAVFYPENTFIEHLRKFLS